MNKTQRFGLVLALALAAIALGLALWPVLAPPAVVTTEAAGDTNFTNVVASGDLTAGDDITAGDDLVVTDAATIGGITTVPTDTEHIGLMTIDAAAVLSDTDGALWTVGTGEVWFVHAVYCHVTTNFDCTGDDCTLQIGDGNDANGLLDLVDAELQAADTEGTGAAAGWQGFMSSGTRGAYLAEGLGFVYTADTIDIDIEDTSASTDPTAGAATCYIVYTRIQ